MNYSYKREEEDRIFREEYLKQKENDFRLYPNMKFCRLSKYSEIRFLSLGESMDNTLLQWICFREFLKDQIKNKSKLGLSNNQVEEMD